MHLYCNECKISGMKRTVSLTVTLLFLTVVMAGYSFAEEKVGTLTITMKGFKSDNGSAFIALANSKESYESKGGKPVFIGATVPVKNLKAEAVFSGIPYGEYAIRVFHDVNGNKKLDTNFLGIPKEPYGFSNNAKSRFGPPDYDKSKFTFKTFRARMTITLK